MKFGEQYPFLMIPEWARMYVDYDEGKLLIIAAIATLPHFFMRIHSVTIDDVDSANIELMQVKSVAGEFRDGKTKRCMRVVEDLITTTPPHPLELIDTLAFVGTTNDLGDSFFFVDAAAPKDIAEFKKLLCEVGTLVSEANLKFFTWLTSQVARVNNFYRTKSQHMAGRIAQIIDDAKKCATTSRPQLKTLRVSLQQAYDAVHLLFNYCMLNHMALCKITKKYAKNTHQGGLLGEVQGWLAQQMFYMDHTPRNSIQVMLECLRVVYARVFHNGDVKKIIR